MQQHIKFLVVEDESEWSTALTAAVRAYFEGVCRLYKARVLDDSALDGNQGYQRLKAGTYDLVTLDMNLGVGDSKSKISGLDLLGRIAAGNRAFFVIIITGAVTDPSLEQIYGREAAALMRFGALNEAVKKLPAERVRILHKPESKDANKAMQQILPHLHSALDQYRSVSLERNIFRPFPGCDSLWEVRYNGGPRLTIPASETFELVRSALSQPNREMKVIQLIQAIAQSSGKLGAIQPAVAQKAVGPRDAGDEIGIDFNDTTKMETPDHFPVDTKEGTITLEVLIGGLLLSLRQRIPLVKTLAAYSELCGDRPLLLLPGKIGYYAARPQRAEEEFQIDNAARALAELFLELKPLVEQMRLTRASEPAAPKTVKKVVARVSTGRDSKELQLARAHWKRARKYLSQYPSLAEFVTHIEECVDRGFTAKGHIYYAPGVAEFPPFWLTD